MLTAFNLSVIMELDHVGNLFTMGNTVSIEERAVLEVQMTKKQIDEKLHRLVLPTAPRSSYACLEPLLGVHSHYWRHEPS